MRLHIHLDFDLQSNPSVKKLVELVRLVNKL